MSLSELRLVAHHHVDFPSMFAVRLQDDGRLLALGIDPLRAAAVAALDMGLVITSTKIVLRYASGKPFEETGTVAEALADDVPPKVA